MGEAKQMREVPQSILDEIIVETFQKLEERNEFNAETIKKMRDLTDTDSLIKGDNLLELLKGATGENP